MYSNVCVRLCRVVLTFQKPMEHSNSTNAEIYSYSETSKALTATVAMMTVAAITAAALVIVTTSTFFFGDARFLCHFPIVGAYVYCDAAYT